MLSPPRMLLAAGSNAQGQLGIGSCDDAHRFTPCRFASESPTVPLGDSDQGFVSVDVATIACGANHTVLLLRHANADTPIDDTTTGANRTRTPTAPEQAKTSLWGAGDGRKGQLGMGWDATPGPWTTFRPLALGRPYTAKHVAAAWETTYVVCACDGPGDLVLSMGSDEFGALGSGSGSGGSATPSNVAIAGSGGGAPRVVGFGHLFEEPPEGLSVRALYAGPRHVVAELVVISRDTHGIGTTKTLLVGWGASRHGQLGSDSARGRCVARPTRLPIPVNDDPVVSCALGNRHTIVLHASGNLTALGSNAQGQIPELHEGVRACALGCTWNGTYVHTEARGLVFTGSGAQGQPGREDGASEGSVVSLPSGRALSGFVCGSEHVLARTTNTVVGWGWNEHGNMGVGSRDNMTIPAQVWPGETYQKYPQKVIGIWAGCATSWLLVE